MGENTPERTLELLHKMHALLIDIGNPQARKDIFVTAMHYIEFDRTLPSIDQTDKSLGETDTTFRELT